MPNLDHSLINKGKKGDKMGYAIIVLRSLRKVMNARNLKFF